MKCSQCRHENEAGAKFCEECAAPLARTCRNCGHPLSPTAKFCPACAHPAGPDAVARLGSPDSYTPRYLAEKILTSKAALEGERKQVTVLFADMKGSMELLADRDPEEARKILDPVLELMMEAVHRYEGTVNQVMGDGIMALFGAPVAHEDHAVRACYAALRMQEAAYRYNEEVRGAHGIEVQLRVGVNSGEVVVRSIGSDLRMDYTAVGQTTHLAARMEQLARPGTVRVTRGTLELAEGYVEVQRIGPIPVKGVAEAVEVYEVTGAGSIRRRFEAAALRGLTRFVGRDAELDQLRQALEQAGRGRGQVVAVVGEPGVGKSRLFFEFAHSHRTRGWLVVETGAASYGRATPYFPVIALLKAYFQIEPRDEARAVREKVGGKLLTLDEALLEFFPVFLALLDAPVDDPQWQALDPFQRRRRSLEGVKRLLLRESQEQPLVVVFDDLHWIDAETQAVLDSLVESLPTAGILLLVNYRTEYEPPWAGKTYYTQLRIDPLQPECAEALLEALLGHQSELAPLKRLLIDRTEGNPFFLEESVRTLVEAGGLVGALGTYRLVQPLEAIRVPPTVEAVLAARIDGLPPEEKTLLQTAAVIGKDVAFSLLLRVAALPEPELRRRLLHLQTAEFLYERRFLPDLEYTFKHALTHEVAYGGLLLERRQVLHAATAQALEALYTGRVEEVYDRLAYHYSRTEQDDKAVEYLSRFAKKAARGHAHVEAVLAFDDAIARVDRLPVQVRDRVGLDLVLREARSLNWLGRNDESLALLLRQQRRLEHLQDVSQGAQYHFALGVNYSLLGDQGQAVQNLERALQEAKRSGDDRTLGRSYALLTLESYWSARPYEGIEHGREAARLLQQTQQWYWLALAHFYLATNYLLLGELGSALDATAKADALADTIGHPGVKSYALSTAGIIRVLAGDVAEGLEACRRGLELSPDPLTMAVALGNFGYARLETGDAEQAIALLERAAGQTAQFRYQQTTAWLTALQGEACLLKGDLETAHRIAARGLDLSVRAHHRHGVGVAERALGRIARALGAPAEAQRYLAAALSTFASIPARFEVGRTLLSLAALRGDEGHQDSARAHVGEAHALFRALGIPHYVARSEVLARTLGVRL
jgi:class 3 adenylate cyclase/tetratricopeptide (TPR) repeat protein